MRPGPFTPPWNSDTLRLAAVARGAVFGVLGVEPDEAGGRRRVAGFEDEVEGTDERLAHRDAVLIVDVGSPPIEEDGGAEEPYARRPEANRAVVGDIAKGLGEGSRVLVADVGRARRRGEVVVPPEIRFLDQTPVVAWQVGVDVNQRCEDGRRHPKSARGHDLTEVALVGDDFPRGGGEGGAWLQRGCIPRPSVNHGVLAPGSSRRVEVVPHGSGYATRPIEENRGAANRGE